MRITELLIIAVSSALAGAATVKTVCGDAVIGQPSELTCEINGNISVGISWYKSGTTVPIIACDIDGNCMSLDSSLYSTTNIVSNVHKSTILNVTKDDLTRTWSCSDGSLTPSLGCTLTQKLSSSTVSMILTSTSSSMILTSLIPTETAETTGNGTTEEVINAAAGCSLVIEAAVGCSLVVVVILVIIDVIIYIGCKDFLSTVKKIYIIYCVVDVVIVGIVDGVATYYIYLRTCDIGIIAAICICFVVVSTIIKIIIVKTKLFSKCSSNESSNLNDVPLG